MVFDMYVKFSFIGQIFPDIYHSNLFSNTSVIIQITGFKLNHHVCIHQILGIQQIYEVLVQLIGIKIVYYLWKPVWKHYGEFQQKMMEKMNRSNKNPKLHQFMQYLSRTIVYEEQTTVSCFVCSKVCHTNKNKHYQNDNF